MKAIKVIIEGKEFKSIGDAARTYGNIPATTYSRLDRGWVMEHAVTKPVSYVTGSLTSMCHADSVKKYNNTHKKKINLVA